MPGVSIAVMLAVLAVGSGPQSATSQVPITIRAAFVRVLDQAEVPASDKGSLKSINVRLGQVVEEGEELARLEDSESRVAVQFAELDVKIATQQAESELPVKVAEAHVFEAELEKRRADLSQEIAEKKASDAVGVEQATKTLELAKKTLDRAVAARADYRPSISEAEVEKRRLEFDIADLELKRAQLDAKVAALKSGMEKAAVEQFAAVVGRLRQEAAVEKDKKQIAGITKQLKERTLELATLQQKKRSVLAPLRGEVTEILRHRGEWVEPGTPIFRVIRLDRLRVEGYIPADRNARKLVGSKVRIAAVAGTTVNMVGTVTYVGSGVDSVNNELSIHVEFENKDLQLRIGEPVEAVVEPKRTGK